MAAPTRPSAARNSLFDGRLRSRTPRWHGVVEWGIRLTAFFAIAAIGLILAFIVKEALPILRDSTVRAEVTPRSMWFPQSFDGEAARYLWQPTSDAPKYSIVPLIIGSLKMTFIALAIGAPIGVMAAVFASHVAPRWAREILKPTVELLAGVPSVVIGVFALMTLATWWQKVFGFEHRLNAALAGAALSLTVIPLVFTIAEDALTAVPKDFVDASLALGATKSHTIFRVVVPAAIPGIAAGVVLGFGRAVGETMIVLMASGNAALSEWTFGHSARSITATIAQEMAEVVHGSPHYVVLFALGAVLLLFTLVTNIAAQQIVEHFRRKRGGS
ncbi:MAG: phosphate ABC transporter permease subunit PstC [Polyangiales bacterium]